MTQHSRTAWQNTLHSIAVASLAVCISAPIHAQTQSGQANATPSLRPGEPVTLNFTNADIEAVSRAMAAITNRNVVVDPRVKGQITLLTDKAVSPATAYQQYLAALRMQGFTVTESAGLFKVIPEADAKLQASEVAIGQGARGSQGGGQIVTQIFKLNYENANNLVPVLRPLISPNNTINVNPGNNSLIITDYADNLQRISRIIASTDVSNATDVEVISLRHAVAADMVALVNRLMEGGSATAGGVVQAGAGAAAGQADTSFRTSILAEPRSNSVLVRAANPAKLSQIRSLIARLDQPAMTGNGDDGNIHVVYLKNADAVSLAATLRAAINAQTSASTTLGGQQGMTAAAGSNTNAATSAQPVISRGTDGSATVGLGGGNSGPSSRFGTAQQPSTGGMIQADPTTNSLIITAPGPLYRQLRTVIDKLDGRRAQVLIEALIVEVSADKAAQLGVQWSSVIRNNGRVLGVLGNGTSISGISNIFGLSGAVGNLVNGTALTDSQASAIGSMKGMNLGFTQSVNGNTSLGALVNLMQGDGDTNILSTPNLMTLDNEEASIMVGENVPFPTGSYTNTAGTSGSVNPFTTYERKDVGTLLKIRPQINENGTIKMAVYQENSAVKQGTANAQSGATTTKRSIESNVLVEDGAIVVLGGLIADEYSQSQERVPLLGDIPLLGNLFRNTSRARKKTNLMVFLRPTVLRDANSTSQLSQDRYESIRGMQQTVQPDPNLLMRNVNAAPLLPASSGAAPARAANVLIVPGAKPEIVDFTRPGQPTVDGQPVTVTPVTPATLPAGTL
ncbi:general secretion pathway protein D [Comamonas testosteroni TK102]|uniref:General secretion pathway protein D n=1 Tax=Comamonas testosteroni TK102 TaxID=1392005 RepID=A0A076PDH7_COMTE|nr:MULTISPECIES: type II secretion system secretin GspD [Comamonas]AIJ44854.1 general secretion pathway protein D [Comamonas testosteroni TK102]MPS91739.1 type II secretion system protein GspD [Comamonas sp.]